MSARSEADRTAQAPTRRALGQGAAAAVLGSAALPARADAGPASRFVVYYGRQDDPALGSFDILVLEADGEAGVSSVRDPAAVRLGYVSIGEVHESRAFFADVAAAGLLVGRHPEWPGAWFVDMRSEAFRRLLIEQVVPGILARGFDGIFLDTLDDAEHLERVDPARAAGMVAGAASTLHALRRAFPAIPVMVNRGYAVLPHVSGKFDMLLGESLRATTDGAGGFRRVSERDYAWQRDRMWEARRRHPALRLFSLDYWDPADVEGVAALHEEQRRNGFIPYVATPDLTRIVLPPAEKSR